MTNFPAVAVATVFLLAAGATSAQHSKATVSTSVAAAAQSGSAMNTSSPMGRMDEHMTRMQVLHEKLMRATTPEERQSVMNDQRSEMRSGMDMMHQMMQGGGTMGSTRGGMMSQKGKPADANAQMQMMQKRMDMMQMMMQTIMDQQGMMTGPSSGGTAVKP